MCCNLFKRQSVKIEKHVKARAKGNGVITNFISAISIAYSCQQIAKQIADQQTEVPVTAYNVNRFTFLFIPRFRENGHVQPIAKKGDSCIMADISFFKIRHLLKTAPLTLTPRLFKVIE